MPTCPRCAALGAALALLAFAGCDTNNPSQELEVVAGSYALSELRLETPGSALDVDVMEELSLTNVRLRIFAGEDREALLEIGDAEGVTDLVELEVSPSRSRVRFDAVDQSDEDDLAELLIPGTFTLAYEGETPSRLEGEVSLSDVDLGEVIARYEGVTVRDGTLTLAFRR